MANRPATGISNSNWREVTLPYPNECKCPRTDGSGQSDPCTEATCGSKCWSQPGANGSTKYQCTKIGYKPNNMSADDVSRPTTIAAFLSTVGSPPQQDVFTGRSSSFSAMESTIWNLAKANENLCGCGKRGPGGLGQIVGCGKSIDCGRDDYYKCYSILAVTTDTAGIVTVGSAVFACIRSRFVNVGSLQLPRYEITPWENGAYVDDPRGSNGLRRKPRREDGGLPVWRNPGGLGSTQA